MRIRAVPTLLAACALSFLMWGAAVPATSARAAPGALATAAGEWQAGPKAKARLVAATTAVGDLDTLPLGLEVVMEPGWKTYWRSPGEAGIPPGVDWNGSGNVGTTNFRWPAPERFDFFGIETFGYHDRIVFPIDVAVAEPGEPVSLRVRADLLICDDVCIPHTFKLSLDLPAGPPMPSAEANLIDRYRSLVPGDGARAGLALDTIAAGPVAPLTELVVAAQSVMPFDRPDLIVEGPDNILFAAPAVERSADGTGALIRIAVRDAYDKTKPVDLAAQELTLTLVDGNRSMEASATPVPGVALLPAGASGPAPAAEGTTVGPSLMLILGLALLGGLILNLMPCVLPVLAIKLLAVVGHGGGDRARVRRGFLASSAGIVAAFALLAALAVALKQAGLAAGWGIQFQQPLFIVAMVAILVLFACNMWGWFEIRLPGAVSDVAGRAGTTGRGHETTLAGSFLQGAFATLLATPCSAPFLGTAVGFALSRGAVEIFAIFVALGVGMALPFLAVAAFPALATRLPRPGPWMIWLKRVLALALLATAVWLITVLAAQESTVAALAVSALMLFAGLLLALQQGALSMLRRVVPALVVASIAMAFIVPQALPTLGVGGGHSVPGVADAGWERFDRAEIPALVARGKTVFVDVTAEWCITCLVNKQRVMEADAVAAALGNDRVVRMRADWTSPDPAIADYLAANGRYGIPFNIVYGPDAPDGIALPELLTESAVLSAISGADRSQTVAPN
ncbi:MAG: protein-disulfide reductase DsbD domain-containing protein [Alphaproteobacteria bacterium]